MKSNVALAAILFLSLGCSHTHYSPEVAGPKTVVSNGGVVFPVPPTHPILKMKLVSLPTPENQTLRVRMYFKRSVVGQPIKASLDPRAQILLLPDHGPELKPTKIYAATKAKPTVDLGQADQQGVELVYALPAGGDKYPYFNLRWSVRYANGKIETQTTRFDRDVKPSGNPNPLNPDFPISAAYDSQYGPEWFGPGYGWWCTVQPLI
jgi:hypothetical protein